MSGWLENITKYDDLTLLLGTSFALVIAFAKWVAPTSLVHPLLLGRQSEIQRVRKSGESVIYRNYGTGSLGTVSSCIRDNIQGLILCSAPIPSFQRYSTHFRCLEKRFQTVSQVVGSGRKLMHVSNQTHFTTFYSGYKRGTTVTFDKLGKGSGCSWSTTA